MHAESDPFVQHAKWASLEDRAWTPDLRPFVESVWVRYQLEGLWSCRSLVLASTLSDCRGHGWSLTVYLPYLTQPRNTLYSPSHVLHQRSPWRLVVHFHTMYVNVARRCDTTPPRPVRHNEEQDSRLISSIELHRTGVNGGNSPRSLRGAYTRRCA